MFFLNIVFLRDLPIESMYFQLESFQFKLGTFELEQRSVLMSLVTLVCRSDRVSLMS